MAIERDEMYIAPLNPRMGACTLSLSKGLRRAAKRGHLDKPFRQGQVPQAQVRAHGTGSASSTPLERGVIEPSNAL